MQRGVAEDPAKVNKRNVQNVNVISRNPKSFLQNWEQYRRTDRMYPAAPQPLSSVYFDQTVDWTQIEHRQTMPAREEIRGAPL